MELEVTITKADLVAEKNDINHKQTLLSILKMKGAPVEGEVLLWFNPKYDYLKTQNPDGSLTYKFSEKPPEKGGE